MGVTVSRLLIAGLSGDSGKTIVSLSLAAAFRRRGLTAGVFKKGPDYIDAAWLGAVAGTACRNLDTFMVPEEIVRGSFARHARKSDIALIEGNRGLFDGKDVTGSHSTAGLAQLLQAPVVLVIDATKMTRTVAALVHGCQSFEPGLHLAGVILNKVAGGRHGRILTDSIHEYCRVPVLGLLPKLGSDAELIPGRHLGLIPPAEAPIDDELEHKLVTIAEEHLDLDGLLAAARAAKPLDIAVDAVKDPLEPTVRIGYFSDSVFTFYYPENLEALRRNGAELVPISSLDDALLPAIDGLYIGGGFPETHAERLASNRALMSAVKDAALGGLPVYAECGGLIYLSHSMEWQGRTYPMAGVFDLDLTLQAKPVGHGYVEVAVDTGNPYFAVGEILRGHEFHYSGSVKPIPEDRGCLRVERGIGLGNRRDGLVHGRTMAAYTHLHADGVPQWAPAMIRNALAYRRGEAVRDAGTGHENSDSDSEVPQAAFG